MKVLGINAVKDVQGALAFQRINRLQMKLDQLQPRSKQIAPPKKVPPPANAVNFSPSDVVNTLRKEAVDLQFIHDQGSGTSLMALKPDINLLSHPDAVAQEMMQNLRGSMSLSGDATRDITLPEEDWSTAAVFAELKEKLDDRFPKLREAKEYKPSLPPEDPIAPAAPETLLPDPPPILIPSAEVEPYSAPKTSNEAPIIAIPPDQIVTPTRLNQLPYQDLPGDVPIVASPEEMLLLETQQRDKSEVNSRKIQRDNRNKKQDTEQVRFDFIQRAEEDDPITQLEKKLNVGELKSSVEKNQEQFSPKFNDHIATDLASVLATIIL